LSYDDSGYPDQLVVARKAGLRRYLHYGLSSDVKTEDENNFAQIIKELTGDFIVEIKCDDIQSETRFYYDEVVYLGSKEDLTEGGSAELLL